MGAIMGLLPHVNFLITVFTVCLDVIIIFVLAPVPNENVPISAEQSQKMKYLVRAVSAGLAIIAIPLGICPVRPRKPCV